MDFKFLNFMSLSLFVWIRDGSNEKNQLTPDLRSAREWNIVAG